MAQAAVKMGIHFNSFKRNAEKFGLYNPNQGSKGSKKEWMSERKYPLQDILDGKYPEYQTFKLKNRLIEEGILYNKCEVCSIDKWNNSDIMCELDHINGKRYDHRLENLRMLCPNCHSQTETHRAKNKRGRK